MKKIIFILTLLLVSCSNASQTKSDISIISDSNMSTISSSENNSSISGDSSKNTSLSSEFKENPYDILKTYTGNWYANDMYVNSYESRDLFFNHLGEKYSINDDQSEVSVKNSNFAINFSKYGEIKYSISGLFRFVGNDCFYMIGKKAESTKDFFDKRKNDVYYYCIGDYEGLIIPSIKSASSDEIIISYDLIGCTGTHDNSISIAPGYYDVETVDESVVNTINIVLNKNMDVTQLKGNYRVSSISSYDEGENEIKYNEISYKNCTIKLNDEINITKELNVVINGVTYSRNRENNYIDFIDIDAKVIFQYKDKVRTWFEFANDDVTYYILLEKIL